MLAYSFPPSYTKDFKHPVTGKYQFVDLQIYTLNEVSPFGNELWKRLKARDKHAFAQLYDNYSAALFGIIKRIIKDEGLSEDILQNVFVHIWTNIESYHPEKASLFTWISTITKNVAIDFNRGKLYRQHQENLSLNIIEATQSNSSSFSPERHYFPQHIQKLSKKERVIIELIYYYGYTSKQASEVLKIPLETIKTRLRESLKNLRGVIQE